MELAKEYIEKMKELLGEEYSLYEKSFEEKRLYGLRVNTLKVETEEFKKSVDFDLEKVHWCENGFYYKEDIRPAKHPYYHAGLYYLQEPSAMSAAAVLDIKEGDKVLDLCAAPGGKTTQLGAKLKNTGVLVANDISPSRAKAIIKNIELFGLKNCIVMGESPEKLSCCFEGYFDKILVDAPCSGEGMFRKEPDLIKSWNAQMLEFCQKSQKDILEQAALMLKAGGNILYSTCTFSPEENEKTINDFLDNHKDFYLEEISDELGFEDGVPNWVANGREELKFTKRLWPYKIKGEGHFLALLKKQGESVGKEIKSETEKIDKRIEYFQEFAKETLAVKLQGNLKIINDALYLLPKDLPNLKGLRVLRSGLLLGEFKKNRFEPGQALAMALTKDEVKNYVSFCLEDHRVLRYLKGETVEEPDSKDGWCLVCCDGYPLGWCKVQKGRLKNKYPTGWFWN